MYIVRIIFLENIFCVLICVLYVSEDKNIRRSNYTQKKILSEIFTGHQKGDSSHETNKPQNIVPT